jgi:hypothetical protein
MAAITTVRTSAQDDTQRYEVPFLIVLAAFGVLCGFTECTGRYIIIVMVMVMMVVVCQFPA